MISNKSSTLIGAITHAIYSLADKFEEMFWQLNCYMNTMVPSSDFILQNKSR